MTGRRRGAPERGAPQVGLCTVRVWRYGDGVAVRVRMRPDASVEETRTVLGTDVEAAAALVAGFLREFRDRASADD